MTDRIERGIDTTLRGLSEIADEGGYRERVAALETIAKMQWFDNFGESYYRHRCRITRTLIDGVKAEDVPDAVAEEFADEVDV